MPGMRCIIMWLLRVIFVHHVVRHDHPCVRPPPPHSATFRHSHSTPTIIMSGAWGDAAPAGAGSDSDAPLPPPPDSYAAKPEADVAIWTVSLQPGARCVLPPAKRGTKRTLYYFEGEGLRVGPAGEAVGKYTGFEVGAGDGDGDGCARPLSPVRVRVRVLLSGFLL